MSESLQNETHHVNGPMLDGAAQDVVLAPAQPDGDAPLGGEVEEKLGWAEVSSRHGVVDE